MGDEVRTNQADTDPSAANLRFDDVVVPHLPVLFRVARAVTSNGHDAEDLVQDTLLRAFRSLDTFDDRNPCGCC